MTGSLNLELNEAKRFVGTINQDLENLVNILNHLEDRGYDPDVHFHSEAESASESSEETGISQERIAKTLVFQSDGLIAVLASGTTQIDEEKLSEHTGSEVSLADPERVEEKTGFVVGGVAPFDLDIDLVVEETLTDFERIKPSGGSSVMSVEVEPSKVVQEENAEVLDLT